MTRIRPLAVFGLAISMLSTPQAPAQTFNLFMTGDQEVPPADPDGIATGTLTINPVTNIVSWNFTYANIAAPTLMHIHVGAAGVNGPILVNLGVATTGGPGTLISQTLASNAAIFQILANPQGYYVNIHNAPFPGGAVRGQLMPGPSLPLTRAQAAAVLLAPASGVEVDLARAGIWAPFEQFMDLGPGFEGLLPPGTLVGPGDALIDPEALPGLAIGPSPSYFFWINDEAPADFEHPVRFAIVDAFVPAPVLGNGITVAPFDWWPLITLPGGDPLPYFDILERRVSDAPAAPGNADGLVGGVASGPGDIVAVEPSSEAPPPSKSWAIVIRGADGANFKANINRMLNDLKEHYKVPEESTVVKGARDQMPASKGDLAQAITELKAKIAESGEPCDKIFLRITTHGGRADGRLSFKDGKMSKAELAEQMRKLAMLGTPVCVILHSCHAGYLLDAHDWDLPAGSSVITGAAGDKTIWSDSWTDADGNAVTGGLYYLAFSQCLRSDPTADPSADKNADGFIDECEAHEWAIAQMPSWVFPGNGKSYTANRGNPGKRVVGLTPGGLNVLVRNNTGAAKTDFHIVFKGNVQGGSQHAWRSNAQDQLGQRWAQAGESVEYDASKDRTTVSWKDQNDPVQPGDYIHFGYAKPGLKPIRQYWTPTGGLAFGDGVSPEDQVPVLESSTHLSSDGSLRHVRVIWREPEDGSFAGTLIGDLFFRALDSAAGLDELSLPVLDLIAPAQPLGSVLLGPEQEQEFFLSVPGQILAEQVLVLEAHLSWTVNGNIAMQLLQSEETQFDEAPSCLGDIDGDGEVNGADLGLLLGNWLGSGVGDLNNDGVVNGADLGVLLGAWGPCSPA